MMMENSVQVENNALSEVPNSPARPRIKGGGGGGGGRFKNGEKTGT